MLLILPTSAVEVKESHHLKRHLELHSSLDCFPDKYTEKEAAPARADTLKRPPGRKRGGGRKKELEITSADFSADENDNENGLIGTEEEGDTSSDTFDEMLGVSYANDNLTNDCLHLKIILRKILIPNLFDFLVNYP